MIGLIVLLIVLVLLIGLPILTSIMSTKVKNDFIAIYSDNKDIYWDIKKYLNTNHIHFNDFESGSESTSFNELGVAQRTPLVVWIRKNELEKFKTLINPKYKIETHGLGLKVKLL
jgi:hypothetical protein